MSTENLKQRLAYFEGRLEEARRRNAAKEPHPRNFDAGYTTDVFKTWVESIAVINQRISSIRDQLNRLAPPAESQSGSLPSNDSPN